jgi:hypothetical protein
MITLACSRLSSLAVCNQLPNDTDDLFLMAFKGLLHTPHVFLEREVLMALVATALRAMLVQQPDAFKSVQSFLWRLFDVRTLEKSHDRMGTQALLQVRMLMPCSLTCACLEEEPEKERNTREKGEKHTRKVLH